MHIVQEPFHADYNITRLFESIIAEGGVTSFVETGSFHGITTEWVARKYPEIKVFSCEIDPEYYAPAKERLAGFSNVTLALENSPQFLKRLVEDGVNREIAVFWIDAHAFSFQWPLIDEISVISQNWGTAYVIIDDFRVPGRDDYGYTSYEYEGKECSYDYIRGSIDRPHNLWYPTYQRPDDIPEFCFRGWTLLTFGVDDFQPSPGMYQAL